MPLDTKWQQRKWFYPEGALHCGYCLQIMSEMESDSVDLVFGSPPYASQRACILRMAATLGISRKVDVWVKWMTRVYHESFERFPESATSAASAVRKRPECSAGSVIIGWRKQNMNLDWQVCSRARLSRDARFDGKFFIAVLSTRIYCRPICPVRTLKESSVRYYPSAAAAAEAGFRPCLLCRPESSPGTPAWFGTSNTVSRALRLIGENGLEGGGVEVLAERLGVGSRHLRRLF